GPVGMGEAPEAQGPADSELVRGSRRGGHVLLHAGVGAPAIAGPDVEPWCAATGRGGGSGPDERAAAWGVGAGGDGRHTGGRRSHVLRVRTLPLSFRAGAGAIRGRGASGGGGGGEGKALAPAGRERGRVRGGGGAGQSSHLHA